MLAALLPTSLAFATPLVTLPLLYHVGAHSSFSRGSLALSLFHLAFHLVSASHLSFARSLVWFEAPAALAATAALYPLLPQWAVTAYASLLFVVEPAVLIVEGIQIVRVILFASRVLHARIAVAPLRAKTAILVVAGVSYLAASLIFLRLLYHANMSVSLSVAVSAVFTLGAVMLVVTLAAEEGIVSDSGMLLLFLAYVCWMAVEVADDVAQPSESGVIMVVSKIIDQAWALVSSSSVTSAFVPLCSVELVVSLAVAAVALFSLNVDLSYGRNGDEAWRDAAGAVRSGRTGWARLAFGLVYAHYLACAWGYGDGGWRPAWRFVEAGVAIVVFVAFLVR